MAKESRDVKNFEKMVLHGYGELFIQQGETEALEIETDLEFMDHVKTRVEEGVLKIDVVGDWLDRISAFFSRGYESQRIRYSLTVKDLRGLTVSGAARVEVDALVVDSLALKLGGAGEIEIEDLQAKQLDVDLPGAGNIKARGSVEYLNVLVGGAGAYSGRRLESRRAKVKISGVGKAILNASEELDINLTGLGSIEYYGHPRVTQNISGLGQVTSKG